MGCGRHHQRILFSPPLHFQNLPSFLSSNHQFLKKVDRGGREDQQKFVRRTTTIRLRSSISLPTGVSWLLWLMCWLIPARAPFGIDQGFNVILHNSGEPPVTQIPAKFMALTPLSSFTIGIRS